MNAKNNFYPSNVSTDEEKNLKKSTTERPYGNELGISYPQIFYDLDADQRRDVLKQLKSFSLNQQQDILNEWEARCIRHDIYNPAGYLFGIIKKARAGEFRLNQCLKESYSQA